MNCQQLSERLNEYLDGVLDDAARAELEEHLGRCEACRRTANAMREAWAALDHWEAPDASPDFRERFWERMERTERVRRMRRRRILVLSPIAVAVTAALVILALILPFHEPPLMPQDIEVEELLGLDNVGVIQGMRLSEQLEALQVLESLNAEDWAYVTGGNS